MFIVTTRNLKILSGVCWYIGSVILILKGSGLMIEAERLRPGQAWIWLAVGVALLCGFLKAKLIFSQFCLKNLARIETLGRPKVWQVFQPYFLIMLFLMMIGGAILSRLAQGNYPALIAVAMLDFSIAIALIQSGFVFWTSRGFFRTDDCV